MISQGRPAPRERRLVFVSAGDHHLLHTTVEASAPFDVVIYFYGDSASVRNGLTARGVTLVDHKGGKFQNLLAAYQSDPAFLAPYDAVLVMDDDLGLSAVEINRLFDLRREHDLWILQPTFDRRSRISFPYSRSNPQTLLRYTNFIEVCAPLFRREKLEEFLKIYDGSLVGWGVDRWYMNVFGENEFHRYAVIDEISCINPDRRAATGSREIDELEPETERRASWERVRDERGLRDFTAAASGNVKRRPADQASAVITVAWTSLVSLVTRATAREAMARSLRGRLKRAMRDVFAATELRRLRRKLRSGTANRVAIDRARRAWGNLARSATTAYAAACIEACRESSGVIVECGSGFTTAVVGLVLDRDGRELVCVEHDAQWAKRVVRRLRLAGIRDVRVLVRPLRAGRRWDWYDVSASDIPERVGLVVCDGPPGHTHGGRAGMLASLRQSLDAESVIILDDVDRQRELETAREWARELGFRLEMSAADSSSRRRHAIIRK